MVLVCIDPGHGGVDPGAVGPGGTREKDIALAISLQLAGLLRSVCDVVMTRTDDRRLGSSVSADLQARANIANRAGVTRFVSVHCNAFNQTAHGTETYAYAPGGNGEKLAAAIQARLIAATGLTNRGVKFKNLHVLRETSAPAVLVETAFISNPTEEKLLRNTTFQAKVARAIAQGVAGHLRLKLPEEVKKVEDPDVYLLAKVRVSKANALLSAMQAEGVACKAIDADPDMQLTIRVRTSKAEAIQKKVRELGIACSRLDLA